MQPVPVVLVRNNDLFYNHGGYPPLMASQQRLPPSFPTYGIMAVPENSCDCSCQCSRQRAAAAAAAAAATTVKRCCCSDNATSSSPPSCVDEESADSRRVADRVPTPTRKRRNSDAKDENPPAKRAAEAKPAAKKDDDDKGSSSDDDDDDSNGKLSASVQVSRKEQFLDGGKFNVTIDVEKYKTDNLKVEVDGRRVTVSGKRLEEVEEEGWRITRLKYLSHVYTVPQSIDIDNLTSSLSRDNKTLTLQAPRLAPDTPKTIPIEKKTAAVLENGKPTAVEEVSQTDSTTVDQSEENKPQDAPTEKESSETNNDADQPTSNSEN